MGQKIAHSKNMCFVLQYQNMGPLFKKSPNNKIPKKKSPNNK